MAQENYNANSTTNNSSETMHQGGTTPATEYKLVIDEVVVEKITAYAAQSIDGIVEMKGNFLSTIQEGLGGNDRTKGVNADVDDQKVTVDLSIILEYGKSANEVFDRIKKVIGKNIKEMTGLEVEEMTVHVVDVMTREEYRQKQGSNNSQQSSDRKAA